MLSDRIAESGAIETLRLHERDLQLVNGVVFVAESVPVGDVGLGAAGNIRRTAPE
jgi:hypothetical protein